MIIVIEQEVECCAECICARRNINMSGDVKCLILGKFIEEVNPYREISPDCPAYNKRVTIKRP